MRKIQSGITVESTTTVEKNSFVNKIVSKKPVTHKLFSKTSSLRPIDSSAKGFIARTANGYASKINSGTALTLIRARTANGHSNKIEGEAIKSAVLNRTASPAQVNTVYCGVERRFRRMIYTNVKATVRNNPGKKVEVLERWPLLEIR
jgi:hypothetical protein